jgi:hypothetical protein
MAKKTKKDKSILTLSDLQRLSLRTLSIRINDLERRNTQLWNKLEALEGKISVEFGALTQVSDLFVTLRKVLSSASAELAGAASFTQQEISRMSSEEYREKVLVPLNMGRRV